MTEGAKTAILSREIRDILAERHFCDFFEKYSTLEPAQAIYCSLFGSRAPTPESALFRPGFGVTQVSTNLVCSTLLDYTLI